MSAGPSRPAQELDERRANPAAGPAIVITGAASGIGKEIARLAALEGSVLVLVDENCRALDEVAAELAREGAQAARVCVEMTQPDAIWPIEAHLAARDLYCDVLVNAQTRALFGPAVGGTVTDQLDVLDMNVRAMVELALRFLPGMITRGHGGILNVGSVAGYAPAPNMAVFAASKAFVNSFTAALAGELAGSGVAVTCIAPGLGMRSFLNQCPGAPPWLSNLVPPANVFDAALAGWLGFKSGQRLVIPSFPSRLTVILRRLVHDSILLRFLGALQRPAETG